MIRFILTAVLAFNTLFAFGQTKADTVTCYTKLDTLTQQLIYTRVDTMPDVKGGSHVLYKEISKRIKYPVDKLSFDSKVIIAFLVMEDGRILGKRIINDIDGTDLASQLFNIVDDLEWRPGTCNGMYVPALYYLPLIVHLAR